jgi:uncharacterized membrane protein YoaK (UPF0700 family)
MRLFSDDHRANDGVTMRNSPDINHGPNPSSRSGYVLFALLTLTFVTGVVDAISFMGLGRIFTANMTGNIVFLGFAVAGIPGLSISRSLASLAAFLVGAAIGGGLGLAMAHARRRWLLTIAAAEAALLFAAAFAALGFRVDSATPSSRLYTIIVLAAVAMGLRNASVRQLAVPDLTTTVLTLTLTGLAAESFFGRGKNTRIGRRVGSVVLMFAGAAIGALLLRRGLVLPLVLSGLGVLAAAIFFAIGAASEPKHSG